MDGILTLEQAKAANAEKAIKDKPKAEMEKPRYRDKVSKEYNASLAKSVRLNKKSLTYIRVHFEDPIYIDAINEVILELNSSLNVDGMEIRQIDFDEFSMVGKQSVNIFFRQIEPPKEPTKAEPVAHVVLYGEAIAEPEMDVVASVESSTKGRCCSVQ